MPKREWKVGDVLCWCDEHAQRREYGVLTRVEGHQLWAHWKQPRGSWDSFELYITTHNPDVTRAKNPARIRLSYLKCQMRRAAGLEE